MTVKTGRTVFAVLTGGFFLVTAGSAATAVIMNDPGLGVVTGFIAGLGTITCGTMTAVCQSEINRVKRLN